MQLSPLPRRAANHWFATRDCANNAHPNPLRALMLVALLLVALGTARGALAATTVAAWGYNVNGQLGNGTTTNSNVPVAVDTSGVLSGKTVTQISAGQSHTVALCSDGTVAAWGNNSYGQLGTNDSISFAPVAVASGVLSGKTVTQVSAGYLHTVALCSDGNNRFVAAWGYNSYGQLGTGNYLPSRINVPVAVDTSGVLSGKTVTQISAGGLYTVAVATTPVPPSLNNATYSTAQNPSFSQQLNGGAANGGTLSYALAGGTTLPTGLTLSTSGLISGTPTAVGNIAFSVTLSESGGGSITAKFIIVVSAPGADRVGPVLTSNAPLGASYTRSGLASLIYTGTVKDVAQDSIVPSGVKQVLFQLRQGSTAYSGNETTGFTTDLNRGYFPAFIATPVPNDTTGTSTFRRNFGSFIPTNLPAGNYSMVILGQDNLNNFSVEVVQLTITAPPASPAISPVGVSGSANGS